MGRQRTYETLEACNKELTELEEKRKEVLECKVKIETADNERLGAVVRKEFDGLLPAKKGEQRKFFKTLRALYESQLKKDSVKTKSSDKDKGADKGKDKNEDTGGKETVNQETVNQETETVTDTNVANAVSDDNDTKGDTTVVSESESVDTSDVHNLVQKSLDGLE